MDCRNTPTNREEHRKFKDIQRLPVLGMYRKFKQLIRNKYVHDNTVSS